MEPEDIAEITKNAYISGYIAGKKFENRRLMDALMDWLNSNQQVNDNPFGTRVYVNILTMHRFIDKELIKDAAG